MNEIYRIRKELQKEIPWDMDMPPKGAVHLSLCAGYDGIGLGLEIAGVDIGFTVYVEIEAYAAANLAAKINSGNLAAGVLYSNVKTFPFGRFRGLIDILSGGFPCGPFSEAGRRKGDTDDRHLFPYFKEGIEAILPSIVFLENVKGISSSKLSTDTNGFKKGTPVLQYVLGELEGMGYTATAVPATAEEAGSPTSRYRWFIIAILNSKGQRRKRDASIKGSASKQNTKQRYARNPNRSIITKGLRRAILPNKKTVLQKCGEPPRVIKTDEITIIQAGYRNGYVSSKHTMGRDSDVATSGVDDGTLQPAHDNTTSEKYRLNYEGLCNAAVSPIDEMRLLGNGVCPASAAIAFKIGMKECLDKLT